MATYSPQVHRGAGRGEGSALNFSPPSKRGLPEQPQTAVLRLIAYGGERPVVPFGTCAPGGRKEATLRLVNETELDRVITLEKRPAGVSVLDENGTEVVSVPVGPRSCHTLLLVWSPESTGSLCESLRWCMSEGARQVRLEARLQGTAADAPAASRTSRAIGTAGVKCAGAAGNASTVRGLQSKPQAAPSAVGKALPRTLSLVRPAGPAPAPAAASAAMAAYPGLPHSSKPVEPLAVAAASSVKLPATPLDKGTSRDRALADISPQLSNGRRAPAGRVGAAPARNDCTPTKAFTVAAAGRALDFRRVGGVEGKRERGLFAWMNCEVRPVGSASEAAADGQVEGHVVRRLYGEVSGKAYLYFKRDEGFAAITSKVEAKIAAKHLVLRDPENILSDVRSKRQAVEVLTAYHPFWLAVGLQTVLGKAMALSHANMLALLRSGVEAPAFLRACVVERLLGDPELTAQARVTACKQDFWEALGARVLGRMLLLVLLLDRMAQRGDLPPGTPSLFRQDASIKSSDQVLQELLQPRLAGAGDVRHTLRMQLGCSADYVQHARHEADFRVHKPADLRDGTRLAKLFDNLRRQAQPHKGSGSSVPPLSAQASSCSVASSASAASRAGSSVLGTRGGHVSLGGAQASGQEDLLPSLAFPQHTGKPIDESQMRNNCLRLARALQLQGIGIQGLAVGTVPGARDVSAEGVAKAVAEGLIRVDQRVTLGLLWHMAMHFKLKKHVDVRALEREAARLRRMGAALASSAGHEASAGSCGGAATAADDPVLMRYFNDPTSQALLQWLRAACALHGLTVNDFTWALSDGRALCYLIHTYLPDALPLSSISSPALPTSADEMARLTGGTEYVKLETLKENGWAAVYEMGGAIHDDALAAAYKRSVAANFAAAHAAGEALGVPAMLGPEDYLDDGPDELSALLYVALLSEALLKLTAERRAGYVIMEFLRSRLGWRPSRMRACLERFKEGLRREEAAATIQAHWRARRQRCRYLELVRAACVLQAYARRRLVALHLQRQQLAAIRLQAAWRGCVARQQLHQARRAAVVVQAAWRACAARRALVRQHAAACVIQRHVRRYLHDSVRAHERLLAAQRSAAVAIQTAWRGYLRRHRFLQLRSAAIALQAYVRMQQAKARFAELKHAAVVLQAAWRGRQARVRYQEMQQMRRHAAATAIQSAWRRHRAMQLLHTSVNAAVTIQAAWRAHSVRQRYLAVQAATIQLQAAWRAYVTRRAYLRLRAAAVILQAAWRGRAVREEQRQQHVAATAIQTAWRAHAARCRLQNARGAAVRIQAAARCLFARKRYTQLRNAAVVLQSAWRGRCVRMELHAQARAATTIQAWWRCVAAKRDHLRKRRAAVLLQAAFRGFAARRRYAATVSAAMVLQGTWRCLQARRVLAARAEAYYAELQRRQIEMMAAAGRHYMRMFSSAIKIQAFWRGYKARREYIPVLTQRRKDHQEHKAATVIQAAWRGYTTRKEHTRVRAALATIGRLLVPIYRARKELRRRRERHQQRTSAAVLIQSCVRTWLARRRLLVAKAAATHIQAVWRGHKVRSRNGRAKQEARRRLELATAEARKAPHRQLGYRTREALEQLLRHKSNMQAHAAINVIERSTAYSRDCCKLICESGGVAALLRYARGCNRSAPHVDVLNRTLAVLRNICRYDALLPDVFGAEDCLAVLSEKLQVFRDTEEVFMPTCSLLKRLVSREELAAEVPVDVLKHWEGIHQVLHRKADTERKYLERLEGNKGSDVTARPAACKLIALDGQLEVLEEIISRAKAACGNDQPLLQDVVNDQDKDFVRRLTVSRAPPTTASGAVPSTGTSVHGAGAIPGIKNVLVRETIQRMAAVPPSIVGIKRGNAGPAGSPGPLGKGGPLPRKMARLGNPP